MIDSRWAHDALEHSPAPQGTTARRCAPVLAARPAAPTAELTVQRQGPVRPQEALVHMSQSDLDAMLDGARQAARLAALREVEEALEQRVTERVADELATALEQETAKLRTAHAEQLRALAVLLGEQVAALQTHMHQQWADACEQVGQAILGTLWSDASCWPAYVQMIREEAGLHGPCQLRVHPSDLPRWRDAFVGVDEAALTLVGDHLVKAGGCLLQTRDTVLDLRQESQSARWRELAQRVREEGAQP